MGDFNFSALFVDTSQKCAQVLRVQGNGLLPSEDSRGISPQIKSYNRLRAPETLPHPHVVPVHPMTCEHLPGF